jgi:hypothetical protein
MAPGFSRFFEDFALPAIFSRHEEKSVDQPKIASSRPDRAFSSATLKFSV